MNRVTRRLFGALTGLRMRLTLGLLTMTLIACIGFALAIHEFVEVMQDELLNKTVTRELDSLVVDYRHGVPIAGRRGAYGHVYVSRSPEHDDRLPSVLRRLGSGDQAVHDIHHHEYYMARRDVDGAAIYLMVGTEEIEDLEGRLEALGWTTLGVTLLIALLISLIFARLILRPVRRLASRLSNCQPGQPSPPIADEYGDRDMRDIAASFDELVTRFNAAIAREKAFTEDASHELRSPLAVAMNASELLDAMSSLDDLARRRVTRVRESCGRMHRLVTALLFLARDRKDAPDTTCDAALVLDAVLDYQREVMRTRKIKLSVHSKPTLLPLQEGVVYSLLYNLIDNAVRHTEDARIHIEITPQRIRVADEGCGMTAEARQHVLERRYRSADSPGLGVGLYIVSRICDLEGWRIRVVSEPGEGTQIDIVL